MAYHIPAGIIIPWPSTNASIPAGWTRVTAFDGIFTKGVATAGTDPGTTGGSSTHSHTAAGTHLHSMTHGHTTTGTSAASSGAAVTRTAGGAVSALSTHTHAKPATVGSTSVNSGTASPAASQTQSNDPPNLVVIWIQSDTTATGIPNAALAMYNSDTLPSSWTRYANSANNFFKGAAAAGDGGATNAGNVSHTHTVDAHTHTGTAHVHTSVASGAAGASTGTAGASTAGAGTAHTHTPTTASTATAGLDSGAGDTTASGGSEPPSYKLNVIQNGTGGADLPIYLIAGWTGTIANLPVGWVICDGTNSTPNLLAKYIKGTSANGELGVTAGSATHSHTGGAGHTHTQSTHTHSLSNAAESGSTAGTGTSGGSYAPTGHTHTWGATDTDSTGGASTSAGTTSSDSNEPSFQTVAWVQWQEIQIFPDPVNDAGTNTGASTTHNTNIPAAVAPTNAGGVGDLLINFANTGSSGGPGTWGTTPTGWTKFLDHSDGVSSRGGIFYKVADGTEGATLNFPTTGSSSYAAHMWRIDAASWDGNTANIVISSIASNGNPPDPPSLTTGYQGATLFFAWAFASATDSTVSNPTNYSGITTDFISGGTITPEVVTAWRQLNALSDNPGVFTGFTVSTDSAYTIGIKGAVQMPTSEVQLERAPLRGVSRGVQRGVS